jgi:hypothetical protein
VNPAAFLARQARFATLLGIGTPAFFHHPGPPRVGGRSITNFHGVRDEEGDVISELLHSPRDGLLDSQIRCHVFEVFDGDGQRRSLGLACHDKSFRRAFEIFRGRLPTDNLNLEATVRRRRRNALHYPPPSRLALFS